MISMIHSPLLSIDTMVVELFGYFFKLGGTVFVMGLFCIVLVYYIIQLLKKLEAKDVIIEQKNEEIKTMLKEQIQTQHLVKEYNMSMNNKFSEINYALRNNDQMLTRQLLQSMNHEMKQKFEPIEQKSYEHNMQ